MKSLNQKGAVSLISVLIFSTIITIVASAYMSSIVSQQRQSITYDHSNRAYYAAESAVQDAARALLSDPNLRQNGQNSCRPLRPAPEPTYNQQVQNIGYTCQLITVNPTSIVEQVDPARSAFLQLRPADTSLPSGQEWRLRIRWSRDTGPEGGAGEKVPRADNSKLFPPLSQWGNEDGEPYHPVLRFALISVPNSGITRSNVRQRTLFLNPTQAAETLQLNFTEPQPDESVVRNANCTVTGSYGCEFTVRLSSSDYRFTSHKHYILVRSLYEGTDFEVTLQRCTASNVCTEVSLTNTQAVIDVTAQSNQVFRRIQQRVRLTNDDKIFNGLDGVITAGDGICKTFKLGTTAAQYEAGCDPSQ